MLLADAVASFDVVVSAFVELSTNARVWRLFRQTTMQANAASATTISVSASSGVESPVFERPNGQVAASLAFSLFEALGALEPLSSAGSCSILGIAVTL